MVLALQRKMLENDIFQAVVKNTPLISIDICLVHENKILLGMRNNEPLMGKWFTPGGRIFKNEAWQESMRRIIFSELGLSIDHLPDFKLMGVWDHFYKNSAFDKNISTHYVNLPHYCMLKEKPKLYKDRQHDNFLWFDLEEVACKSSFHQYMQSYASWLININKNDM
jgi:colanic acid biosynthesis protein WcaH